MRKLLFGLIVLVATPAVVTAQGLRDEILKNGVSEEVVIAEYPAMSVRTLTAAAGAVVHISVRNSDTFLSSDGNSVVTDYRVAIIDVIKDSAARLTPGDIVTVRRLGGTLDIEGRTVLSNEAGFAPFSSGAEYVLFLKTDSGQPFEMFAGPQSAYRVHEGTATSLTQTEKRPRLVPMESFLGEIREVSGRASGTR